MATNPVKLSERHRPASPWALFALVLLALVGLGGCAYFNTYYNARKLYRQADRSRGQFPDTNYASGGEATLYQKAADKFALVIAKYPQSRWAVPSLYYMAESAYRRQELSRAQKLFEDVWQLYPSSRYAQRAKLRFALCSWRLGEEERGLRMLASIAKADRGTQEQAGFLAPLIRQSSGHYEEAALGWERFLYQYPKSQLSSTARYQRAQCLMSLGQDSLAAQELRLLLSKRQRKSFRQKARLLLAQSLQSAGQYEEALSLYLSLEKSTNDPNDLRTIALNLARIQASQQPADSARETLRTVALRYPRTETSAIVYFSIAERWEQENNLDSAQAYYTLARQESPQSPVAEKALRSASDIAMLQALSRRAMDEKALEQSAAIQFLMAEHYLFQLGQPDQALEKYSQISITYPDLPIAAKALYASGWVHLHHRADSARADSIFRQLIETYPRTRYANAARERLGLPWDSTVVDSEPEIGLASPLTVSIDTTKIA